MHPEEEVKPEIHTQDCTDLLEPVGDVEFGQDYDWHTRIIAIYLYFIKLHLDLYTERVIRANSGPKLPSPVTALLIK